MLCWGSFLSASRNQHLYRIHFPSLANQMCVVSLVLVLYRLTDTDWLEIPDLHFPELHCPQNKVLSCNRKYLGFISTSTNFDLGLLSLGLISPKNIEAHFTFPPGTNIHIYRICFPWPSGPKQILTWVYFPSTWFLQNLLGLVSLSLMASTYTYRIRFPWPSGPKQMLT